MSSLGSIVKRILPQTVVSEIYFARNKGKYQAEALPEVRFSMFVSKNSPLWIARVTTPLGHEIGVCRWFEKRLRPGDVFFDVGSCFGYFPMLVSVLQPTVPIHVFEANWKLATFVRHNATLSKNPEVWRVNTQFVGSQDAPGFVALDSYVKALDRPPTVVKIDVDGGEWDVLKGSADLIAKRKTHFLIEMHPNELAKIGTSMEGVLEFFPSDYALRILTHLRDGGEDWLEDPGRLYEDPNPYVYAAPREIVRD